MHLILFDHIIQLDSLAPVIDLLRKEKNKIIILNTNPLYNYNNNKLIKYFKDKDIKFISFPSTNLINKIKILFLKLITLLPKKQLLKFTGLWFRVGNGHYLDKDEFIKFIKENDIKIVSIPNDLTLKKKVFINECKQTINFLIIEIEVGLRTIKTSPYGSNFPIEYCDYYIAPNNLHEMQKDPKARNKMKYLGCLRYSNQWIKKLDEINKFDENSQSGKIKLAIFLQTGHLYKDTEFMKLFKGIKNLEIEFGNKPKSLLPQKCCNFLYDKFNTTQLINWADLIVSHSSSILIEAILKSKKVFYCDFLTYSEKFKVEKIYYSEIEGFHMFQNSNKMINELKNLKKKPEKVNYSVSDINLINELKGFNKDDEIINNYRNFYKNIIFD